MTTIEQIIQELEQVPEPLLSEVLNFVRSLRVKQDREEKTNSKAMVAFLNSLKERKEVYRRLADS